MDTARTRVPACRRRAARRRRLLLAILVAFGTLVLGAGVDPPGEAGTRSAMAMLR